MISPCCTLGDIEDEGTEKGLIPQMSRFMRATSQSAGSIVDRPAAACSVMTATSCMSVVQAFACASHIGKAGSISVFAALSRAVSPNAKGANDPPAKEMDKIRAYSDLTDCERTAFLRSLGKVAICGRNPSVLMSDSGEALREDRVRGAARLSHGVATCEQSPAGYQGNLISMVIM